MRYFEIFNALKTYYKSLTEAGEVSALERAQGRFDSPLLFIFPDFHSPFSLRLITFIRDWLQRHEKELRGAKFHQTCCLSYRKGKNMSFANEVLSNELRCICPPIICSTVPLNIKGERVIVLRTIPKTLFSSCNSVEIEEFFERDGFRLEEELNQLFPIFSSLFS